MKQSLRFFMVSLLCAMTMSSWAQTTLFSWKYDGSTTAHEFTIAGIGGSVTLNTTDTSKSWSTESATYNSAVTDADLIGPSKGLKFGSNALYLKVDLTSALAEGDIIYICGYNGIAVSSASTSASDADITTLLSTGTGKNDYNVGQVAVLEAADGVTTLYIMRAQGSGTGIAAIKIVRPSSEDKEDVTMSFPEESYSVMEGTTFEAPELTVSPEVSPITFASSNEDVATVDESTGAVTVVAQGTTTITASFAGDDTYNAATASYTLNVTRFINGTLLIDYPNTNDGITISGTTVEETVKIHSNTDAIKGIGLKNGYSNGTAMNGNHIKLEVEGGFKKGDVLTIAGAYNNSSEKDARVALFTSEDGETAIVIKDDFEPFINGRLVDDEPVEQTYTLENDYDVLYLGRNGNTNTYVTLITMVRPNSEEPEIVDVTISASTYATYYNSSMAMRAPADVSVNLATMGENSVTLTSIGQIIPKGCPVVLHANVGTYTLQHEALADNMENTRPNDLIGTEEAGTFGNDGAKYYVLSWKDKNKNVDEVGFYWLQGSGGAYAKVKAHQAYMRIDEGAAPSGVNGFSFTFDEATGITTIDSDSSLDVSAPMYNLAGQRVSKDYKGVVIQDGKKTIKK